MNEIFFLIGFGLYQKKPQMSYSGHSSELQDIEVVPLVLVGALDVIHHILNELPEVCSIPFYHLIHRSQSW